MAQNDQIEILLVEDNPDDAELALRALGDFRSTSHIHVCRDGEEALDLLLSGDAAARALPRVILLDLKLPRVDGIQVLDRLKSDELTRHIPVVVLTASKEDRDVEACYKRGVNSYVVKPIDFEQFRIAMRRIGHYWLRLNNPPLN